MAYLWEGSLTMHLSERGCSPGDTISTELISYYQDLQKNAEMIVTNNSLNELDRIKRLIEIDAKLSFMLNELVVSPMIGLSQYCCDEARYYQADYLELVEMNKDTLIHRFEKDRR